MKNIKILLILLISSFVLASCAALSREDSSGLDGEPSRETIESSNETSILSSTERLVGEDSSDETEAASSSGPSGETVPGTLLTSSETESETKEETSRKRIKYTGHSSETSEKVTETSKPPKPSESKKTKVSSEPSEKRPAESRKSKETAASKPAPAKESKATESRKTEAPSPGTTSPGTAAAGKETAKDRPKPTAAAKDPPPAPSETKAAATAKPTSPGTEASPTTTFDNVPMEQIIGNSGKYFLFSDYGGDDRATVNAAHEWATKEIFDEDGPWFDYVGWTAWTIENKHGISIGWTVHFYK